MTTLKIRDLSFMTINVEVTRGFRIRMAAAVWLIKLAARVGRCGIEIKSATEQGEAK